jgi:hypothetical protein
MQKEKKDLIPVVDSDATYIDKEEHMRKHDKKTKVKK